MEADIQGIDIFVLPQLVLEIIVLQGPRRYNYLIQGYNVLLNYPLLTYGIDIFVLPQLVLEIIVLQGHRRY